MIILKVSKMPINKISSVNNNSLSFGNNNKSEQKKHSMLKPAVVTASALGVGTAYALIAKKQGFSLNPSKILKTPVKDWSLFKLYDKKQPDRTLINLEEKEILALAGGSVTGGLTGGILFDDKKNIKAKTREAVNQFLGNVLIPVAFVGATARLYDKYKPNILSKVPQFSSNGKFMKGVNKALKCLPSAGMTLAALGAGIVTGNRVSNFLNEKVFHKKVERQIKGTDFAPHVDDIGMAVTLMADKSKLSTAITNTVPFFLCVPGIQTGMAKEQ